MCSCMICCLIPILLTSPVVSYMSTDHKVICPDPGVDPLGINRVDCFLGGRGTEEECHQRGCCWQMKLTDRQRAPQCFFPHEYGYYAESSPVKTGNSWRVFLRRYDTPTLFNKHVDRLGLVVEEQTDRRLRIKFYEPGVKRFEVPHIHIEGSDLPPRHALYRVEFTQAPFSVKVIRSSNNKTLFDTSMGGLVFSEQFLQLSAKIGSSDVYGLGEHLHMKLKHDMDWRAWPIYAAGKHPIGPSARNLYGAHPVYLNREDGRNANMVLLLNQHAMEIVLQPRPAVTFRTIGGVLDFYIFLGQEDTEVTTTDEVKDLDVNEDDMEDAEDSHYNAFLKDDRCDSDDRSGGCGSLLPHWKPTAVIQAIQEYQKAIGLPMMPPYWALGFHLCRWNYTDSHTLKEVINRNRMAGIPYDVQWGDVDFMEQSQSFTIDRDRFSDLPQIVDDLHRHGQKYVAIHDPGIKVRPPGEYEAYDDGTSRDVWIRHANGDVLEGKVWAGICVFADYTNQETQKWWTEHSKNFHDQILRFDGFWIDMNEPSNFIYGSTRGCENNTWNSPPWIPGITGGLLWDRTLCMDAKQALGRHYDLHSLYGHTMINATAQAGREIFGQTRSLIVSRSTFVGSGQFAGKWLGDNNSSFIDMKWSITGMVEFNMFGFPFVGADICGFFNETTEQLCQRWQQLGAFYPFSRNHNANGTRHQDPASFGEDMVKSTKFALRTRYRLLPYLYTLFHLAHTTGVPVIRALAFEFPWDKFALSVDEQFLWGPALLISPVLRVNTYEVHAYFPKTRWYNFYSGDEMLSCGKWRVLRARFDEINLHVRGGYIIPMQRPANTTQYSRRKPMSLLVALDGKQEADGMLFSDDGETLDTHKTKEHRKVYFYFSKNQLLIHTWDSEGNFDPGVKLETIMVYGLQAEPDQDRFSIKPKSSKGIRISSHSVSWNAESKGTIQSPDVITCLLIDHCHLVDHVC